MLIDEYHELHLELTSKCTLKCPLCPRTEHFGDYKVTDLPIEMIQRIVSTNKVYSSVSICGDHGDPIYHSQFHEAIELLHQLPKQPFLKIATNGSYKKESWWQKTAETLLPKDRVIFGIDGLEDTNPLYRVNAEWNSIIKGIKTLRKNPNVDIVWQWILFEYNQHQLTEAKKLANDLGINKFLVLLSSRYDNKTAFKEPTLNLDQVKEIIN